MRSGAILLFKWDARIYGKDIGLISEKNTKVYRIWKEGQNPGGTMEISKIKKLI